ncbi:MAG: WYL domain-containing protein [Candidatus Nanopelagicales bacterium]
MPRAPGGNQAVAVARALNLIRFLSQRGDLGASVDDLRRRVPAYAEWSQDQIARDIRNLEKSGWRITNTAPRGEPAHYRIFPRDHRVAVSLTAEERAALQRLAEALEVRTEPLAVTEPSGGMPAGAAEVDLRLHRDREAERVMKTLYDAIDQRREVAFVHIGRARRIHPYALRHGEGIWWVDGLDVDADGPRSFPVAHVEQPIVGPPNAYDRPSWARPPTNDPLTWRRSVPTRMTLEVEAEFAPDARAAFAPIIVDDAPGEPVQLIVDVVHRSAFRTALYQLAGTVRVVAPPEAVEEERAWLEQQLEEQR